MRREVKNFDESTRIDSIRVDSYSQKSIRLNGNQVVKSFKYVRVTQ